MKVVIVTGLSGAGKTQAIICLEDLGFYCVDNMPPALIKSFIELALHNKSEIEKAAFVIDIRGGDFFTDLEQCITDLSEDGFERKVLFLEASEEVLIRRYNETRRTHPLAEGASNIEGIKKEKAALANVRKLADYVIDTSNMKSMRLKQEIMEIFSSDDKDASTFTVNIKSFGYKNGIPLDADMVFDMRFIPNPFYVPSLKKLTGNSKKVRDYVMKHEETKAFVEEVDKMIKEMIPCFVREGKYHLNIAFGCTGGQHRSVTLANEFAEIFKAEGKRVTIEHRDL